jgi:hypothetical protein
MTRSVHMTRSVLKSAVGLGFAALLVNTGYIAAFASPTIFYMANVLVHLVLGVALAAGFAVLLRQDREIRRWTLGAAALFTVALGTALYLVVYGNVHDHGGPAALAALDLPFRRRRSLRWHSRCSCTRTSGHIHPPRIASSTLWLPR